MRIHKLFDVECYPVSTFSSMKADSTSFGFENPVSHKYLFQILIQGCSVLLSILCLIQLFFYFSKSVIFNKGHPLHSCKHHPRMSSTVKNILVSLVHCHLFRINLYQIVNVL